MLNIDMQKEYDSIEWPFLQQILISIKFPAKFVTWIMKCVRTVSYSIIVNVSPAKPFVAKIAIMYRDPVSLFLFVMAMKYLNRLLKQLETTNRLHFHPNCGRLKLIQPSFADELLLFCKGEVSSIKHLFNQFQMFSKTSLLITNWSKSSVYCE